MHYQRSWTLVDLLVERRWLVLAAIAAGSGALHLLGSAWFSWHYVVTGSQSLFSATGLHLYAQHPDLQMGPLTFVIGAIFAVLLPPAVGHWAVIVFLLTVGILALRESWYLASPESRVVRRRWMLAASAAMVGWSEVAVHFAHLDDAVALLLMMRALRLAKDDRIIAAALFVGLAVDFKPWALPAAAVLVVARSRLRPAALTLVAVVVLVWLPFLIADSGTLHILGFQIPVSPASSLHVLGVGAQATPPWDRLAQLGVGTLLAAFAARRGRWSAVLLLIVTVRMLLDPATYPYYDSGLLLAAAVVDGAGWRRPLPVATMIAFVTVYVAGYLAPAAADGVIRTIGLVALLILALIQVGERRREATTPAQPLDASLRATHAPGFSTAETSV